VIALDDQSARTRLHFHATEEGRQLLRELLARRERVRREGERGLQNKTYTPISFKLPDDSYDQATTVFDIYKNTTVRQCRPMRISRIMHQYRREAAGCPCGSP